jgi:hypothetical protein
MKRGRGRPPVYENATQQPGLVALRIPRALEARLRHEASEQGRTRTAILLQALVAQWEHPHAAADLAETQAQLATLKRQYVALERKSARLKQRYDALRVQAAADKKERARLIKEREQADEHVRWMHERLIVFTADNPDLAEENARRYAKVQGEAWRRRLADIQEEYARCLAETTGRAGTTSVPVKDLIKLCHPDKWSQGQPATELAHELMVRLTK